MKKIVDHFKTHPDATEVHETSNGFLFHEKHNAVAHANELGKGNDKVTTHSRSDFDLTEKDEASKSEKKSGSKKSEKADGAEA